ncbi:biotin attachment protein [Propioniciclava coleopterorum]|uniref:Biotin attachment protein n=1 Tax=Propioniciclava coleopterorum TaxID=2714937 RepID=A0A6G7Y7J6_9ACTN|nr:lipoyl domain-containing protein [Propioniciclava coleopterorum]QIK72587.1 biotin attachment protein [Propioniciclava coleopterorum]
MTELTFPQMSPERPDATGVLATWYAADGEAVGEGQLVGEVQMDKVDAEVFAPVAGTITLLVAEGDEVAQGAPIARIA